MSLLNEMTVNPKKSNNLMNLSNNTEKPDNLDKLKEIVEKEYDNNFISYAMDKSKYIILNEENNIAKHILIAFIVNSKMNSVFDIIQSESDTGKSYTFEILLNYFIPEEYVIKMNAITEAAFRNQCIDDEYLYNGKLLYFGDLGNKQHRENMSPVFNIIKQVISEKEFHGSKMGNDNQTTISYSVKGVLGALYCDVINTDDEDDHSQIASRSIISTPALNSKDDKITFQKKISTKVTYEHYLYNETIADLKGFKEYYKDKVEYYRLHVDSIEVINPFFHLFDKISEHRLTETRELFLIDAEFKGYCILNEGCCFKYMKTINNEKLEIFLPKVELIQSFINIIYSGVGLKPQERNLILKLKKEFDYISEKDAINSYKSNEGYKDRNHSQRSDVIINEIFDQLLDANGVKSDNPLFFRATDIGNKFRNSNEIKRVSHDLSDILRDLERRNFLKKFEEKYNRANVYYFNDEIISNIEDEYTITSDDISDALDYIKINYKSDITKKDGSNLFNDKEMGEIIENYKK